MDGTVAVTVASQAALTARDLSNAALVPLLGSLNAVGLQWLDYLLPPFLLAIAVLLYDVDHPIAPRNPDDHHGPDGDKRSPPSRPIRPKGPLAHVYINRTSHARFLPKESQHVFTYPVLQFGFDIDALERGAIDLPGLFRYLGERPPDAPSSDASWLKPWSWTRPTVTSLSPDAYLRPWSSTAQSPSLKARLLTELAARHSVDVSDIDRCYLVTMPRFFGHEGINPLSVWFCYGAGLKVVVLEVHNTFGERSLYVLEPHVDEEERPQSGYEHQWLVPRSFHVSPFNDRSGFYRVCLNDPFASSTDAYLSRPRFKLKIVLLTSPEMDKKFYASLAGEGVPLAPRAVLSALSKYPLDLALTMPRILFQASALHFTRRLDVFPRPEPAMLLTDDERLVVPEEDNPIERGGKIGGIGWLPSDWATAVAKKTVVDFLTARILDLAEEALEAAALGDDDDQALTDTSSQSSSPPSYSSTAPASLVSVRLVPADTNDSVLAFEPPQTTAASRGLVAHRTLTIRYLTPLFFRDLVSFPTPEWSLAVGSKAEKRWSVDDDELFLHVFGAPPNPRTRGGKKRGIRAWASGKYDGVKEAGAGWAMTRMRSSQARWGLSFAGSKPTGSQKGGLLATGSIGERDNPLDAVDTGAWTVAAMGYGFAVERLVYHVFRLTGSRFVKGTEPWGQWARAVDQQQEGHAERIPWDRVGSVLNKK